MVEPKQYKAMTLPKEHPDPFTGKRSREIQGYYYKHEGPLYAFNEGQPNQDRHFLVTTAFADWNMERQVEYHEIDTTTLEEL